jgi:hypothetical protein
MVPNRWSLIACVLLGLAGCQSVVKQTFPERQLETGPERVTPKDQGPLFQASDDPQVIVDRVIQAYGGPEKCTRWNIGHIKYIARLEKVETIMDETFDFPGRFKRVVSAKTADKEVASMTFVINRDEAWMSEPGGGMTPMKETEFADRAAHWFSGFCDPTYLRDRDCAVSVVGEEDVRNEPTVVLRIDSPLRASTVFVSKRNGLMVKTKAKLPKLLSKDEADSETYLSDYRDFDGTKVPTQITSMSKGKMVMGMSILELEFLDKVEDKVFAKP